METKIIRVLLIEGDLRFARAVRESLSALTTTRICLTATQSLTDATQRLSQMQFDAILMDLFVPVAQGIDVFRRIHDQAPAVPIVILTSYDNQVLALQAVREGAQDYLVKSKVDGKILSRVVRYAIERKRLQRRLAAHHAVTSVLAEAATLAEATPKILQAICESTEWQVGALWKVDAEGDVLRCVTLWQAAGEHFPAFEAATRDCAFVRGVGFPGHIWEQGKPTWIVNVAEDSICPRARIAAQEGLHAALGFPVTIDHHILGVIELFGGRVLEPDQDLIHMMTNIGCQVGQFIVRKQAEEDLAVERNILRTLVDTLPDAIYVKDTRSRFILANVGVANLMGAATTESLLGKTDFDFYPAELAQRYYADEQAVLESGHQLINREEPVVDPCGENRWLLTTKAPLRDASGAIIGLVGMGRDITERKREEEQHRLSEARLQAILDNTTAVIYLKDTAGRYLLVNRQFEELFQVSNEQVKHQTDYDLFPSKLADEFQANDRKVLESRTALEFEEVASRNEQLRTYISIKFPLCDDTGRPYGVCGISTDITERKRAEDALRQALADLQTSHHQLQTAQLQLIQAAKMESIGTLAAGVAHEVKNPLQTILMGLAYLSKNICAGNENIPMVLTDMRDGVKRADAIVRDLLYLSAAKQLDIKDEDFNAVLEHALWLVNFEITRSRISVVRDLAADLPRVPLDRPKMEQVLINLFLNAIQAMPDGGTLTVKTSARRLQLDPCDKERTLGPCPRDENVVIAVIQDTGVGIAPEKLPRIFEPFFTTKPTGVGTGLGLPVSKQIIDLHGGAITIEPASEGGVRVSLMLKTQNNGAIYEKETNSGSRRRS